MKTIVFLLRKSANGICISMNRLIMQQSRFYQQSSPYRSVLRAVRGGLLRYTMALLLLLLVCRRRRRRRRRRNTAPGTGSQSAVC